MDNIEDKVDGKSLLYLKDDDNKFIKENENIKNKFLNRKMNTIPLSIIADSYKLGHEFQYPKEGEKNLYTEMIAYGEFRGPYPFPNKDQIEDHRIVFYGIRYLLENYLMRRWTMDDVKLLDHFTMKHNVFKTKYPFPRNLFEKFVEEGGYFPVKIESLEEGTVIYPHIPVYQITAKNDYAYLVTFLETLMTQIWYPSTVATLSRKCKQVIIDKFKIAGIDKIKIPSSMDQNNTIDIMNPMINTKLQDFGFRGCTSVEQSIIGGISHLLNFGGSDTMSASYYSQYVLNDGKPVGDSIPATEHSVMLSYTKLPNKNNEKNAIKNMMNEFGSGIFACVMDTYDYHNTLFNLLPELHDEHKKNGGLLVIRPDSGTPKYVVMDALIAIEMILRSKEDINKFEEKESPFYSFSKNDNIFIQFNNYSVIQGDGVDLETINEILDYIMDKNNRKNHLITFLKNKKININLNDFNLLNGNNKNEINDELEKQKINFRYSHIESFLNDNICYSPINCTFGMGGGLLQKINRDTMRFATKLNEMTKLNEENEENKLEIISVMKDPMTDVSKLSLPGKLAIIEINDDKDNKKYLQVIPFEKLDNKKNKLKIVYDGELLNKYIKQNENFSEDEVIDKLNDIYKTNVNDEYLNVFDKKYNFSNLKNNLDKNWEESKAKLDDDSIPFYVHEDVVKKQYLNRTNDTNYESKEYNDFKNSFKSKIKKNKDIIDVDTKDIDTKDIDTKNANEDNNLNEKLEELTKIFEELKKTCENNKSDTKMAQAQSNIKKLIEKFEKLNDEIKNK